MRAVDGPSRATGTVSHGLPADLGAVREARAVVRAVLADWRADQILDDVELVASELVANALRHGLRLDAPTDPAAPGHERAAVHHQTLTSGDALAGDPADLADEDSALRVSLVSTGSHVICAVTDPSDAPPVRRVPDPLASSGRGLHLVESLSLSWGWTVLDDEPEVRRARGKSVWAIFPFVLPGDGVVGAA